MSKFMRIIVFFDLPVHTKTQRRQATQFRNALLKDGFYMMQFSVYSRVCAGADTVDKHIVRIESQKPKYGSIRVLTVTERQYESMKIILGDMKYNEKPGPQQMTMIF